MADYSQSLTKMLRLLSELRALIPALRAQHPEDGAFLSAFARYRGEIEVLANLIDDADDSTHCWRMVHEQFDEMLESVGLLEEPWYTPAR